MQRKPSSTERAPRRCANLTTQRLADELLVYDLSNDRAHALSELAAFVFECCDGDTETREIEKRARAKFGVDGAHDALSALQRAGLVQPDAYSAVRAQRRRVLKRLGTAALLGPMVQSISAPLAAQAQSCAGLLQLALGRPCCPGLTINLAGICISILPLVQSEEEPSRAAPSSMRSYGRRPR